MPLHGRSSPRLFARPHLTLIALVGLIVPRRLRADWRQEWEAELRHRELLLAEWDRLDWRQRVDLLRRSCSACWDALLLQPRRLEDDMFQDLRYGVRMLVKNPGFTLLAVFTLALGIGANTAIFSLLDKVLMRPLPVDQPHELVTLATDSSAAPGIFSYPLYTDLRDRTDVLSGAIAYWQRPFSLTDGSHSERVIGQITSGNYFSVLGVRPALGRFFLPDEDHTPGTHPVAVVGHGLWRRRFAADPAVIGRSVTLNGYPYTVVGVTPAEFTGTTRATVTDVYVPTMMQAQAMPGTRSMLGNRNSGWLRVMGRLQPHVSRAQAEAALSILAAETNQLTPGPKIPEKLANGILLMDGSRGLTDRVDDLALPLTLLMGVAGLVLLIACANIANLLLARAVTRRKEIAVRIASGASRWRIVRQLLTESAILAALGGSAGLFVASRFTDLLLGIQQQASAVPRTFDGRLDATALSFTLGLSMLTAIVFGLVPSRHAATPDFGAALKADTPGTAGGTRRWSVRNLLIVTQVAVSLVVLIGAGLCVKSLRALQTIDPGFEPAKVVTASFDLNLNGYDQPRGRQFIADVSGRVAALPGVEAVGLANIVAFSDLFWISGATIEGYQPQPNERLAFDFNAVGPNYFHTIGTPLLSGREFTAQDTVDAPRVVVVNEATARRYWPGQQAVGKRIQRGPFLEVVGMVKDSKEKGLTAHPRPAIYLPLLQMYQPELTLHARAATDPTALLASIRREIHALDPALPVYNLATLADQKNGSLHAERVAAALLTLFGLLALSLAAIGLYGMLSYSVTERTRELGIRMALGAQPRDLLTLVVGQGMVLTLVGLVFGVGAAFALTRLTARLLFGVSATDPLTFVLIPVLLACVSLLACWIPARRATRMNGMVALRYE